MRANELDGGVINLIRLARIHQDGQTDSPTRLAHGLVTFEGHQPGLDLAHDTGDDRRCGLVEVVADRARPVTEYAPPPPERRRDAGTVRPAAASPVVARAPA